MFNSSLVTQDKCYRCGTVSQAYTNAVQIVRYGYSGAPINLCNKCFKTFKTWLDNSDLDKELN